MTDALLAQFVAEAADLLADVDDGLLRLEQDPHDEDLVNAVFRAAHTFKGSSGLFDLPELTRLTHAAEDLLDAVRSGLIDLNGDMVDNLLAAFDAVRGWMPTIETSGRAPQDADQVGQALSLKLRTWLGTETDQAGVGSVSSLTRQADPGVARPLPPWLNDLSRSALEELASWLDITGASIRALIYRPDPQCFFRGEDPLLLIRQVPALEQLQIGIPEQFRLDADFDEFECLLRFTALSRASIQEIAHIFRYIPDQVELVEVTAAGLARLLSEVDEPTGPNPDLDGPPVDEVLRALIDAQRRVLENWTSVPAQLISAAETTIRVASALATTDAGRLESNDTNNALAAAQESLKTGLVAPLEEYLSLVVAASPSLQGRPRLGLALDPARSGSQDSTRGPAAEPAEFKTTASDREPPLGRRDDPGTGSRILKIEQSKVDRLLDLVGELVVAKNSLPFVAVAAEQEGHRALARRIKDEYAVVSRVSGELQQAVMDIRMLPVSTAFARVPRLVRDLSRKLGKRVRVVQEGEDTAADKDVIEMLAEPLVHLVRNSLDHGIETPAERTSAGKPAESTLLLRAVPDGDAVVVSVTDDGRGVDTEAVRRKAYERGIIDEASMEKMADSDVANLIFAAGFSTAEQVSDVSGRGVGLDAVRSSIENLGGTVSIDSRPGLGLTIALRLPLTMAVSRVLLITAGAERFGVPLDDVVETVRIPRQNIAHVANRQVLVLRNDVVPLATLTTLLSLPEDAPAADVSVLVVRTSTGPLGMVVDQFHQNTDVILKPLEGLLTATPGYCGTALLGDGLVLLVLDVKELNHRAAAVG